MKPYHLSLVAVALLATAIPAWVVTHAPAIPRDLPLGPSARAGAVVPEAVVPPVEPVAYRDVAPEDALAYNAAIPFSTAPNPPARPFRFYGDADDLARARDCLAAAVWYEAGDDATGEKAVAQVVLNRVRHPAFPSTVCGAVFQGQERRTGCQFTFTCDGALARSPSVEAWDRARAIAADALAGAVYRPVGTATHYHTNWVVPYWSSSLDKIVEVHSHLFFRWTGWWGTPPAFRIRQAGHEPAVSAIARLSPIHAGGVDANDALLAEGIALSVTGTRASPVPGDPDTFLAQLDPARSAETYRVLALATCGERTRCKFMGWTDPRHMPATAPLTPVQMGAMAFSYLRDREAGFERALWNCQQFPATAPGNCMRRQQLLTVAPVPVAVPTPEAAPSPALSGVRRRGDAATPGPAVTPPRTAPATMPSPLPPRPRSGDAASPPPA